MDIHDRLMPHPMPEESVWLRLWREAGKKVDAEEAMVAEYTVPLESRIAELEAALSVFVQDREESCCVNCMFENHDCSGSFFCELADNEGRPCRMGWHEWAIAQGSKSRGIEE